MASLFDRLSRVAGAASDAVYGGAWTYRPMASGSDVNARAAPDPARSIVEGLRAVFGEPSARGDSGPVQRVGERPERPGHASARPFISLDLSRLPYRPARGDLVERDDGRKYRVAEVLPSSPGFARLDLNAIPG